MDTVGWGLVEGVGVGGIWELLFPPGLKVEGRGGKQLQRCCFSMAMKIKLTAS